MAPQNKKPHDPETILEAIAAIKSGRLGLREAARQFGIPHGTLSDKISGRRPIHRSPRPVGKLSTKEENELLEWLIYSKKRGFGYNHDNIKRAVQSILQAGNQTTLLKVNFPGKKWIGHFLGRHKAVLRKAQPCNVVSNTTANAKSKAWIKATFTEISQIDPTVLSEPERIYSCDEVGFPFCPDAKRIRAPGEYTKGTKQATVLGCGSASGDLVEPFFTFPKKRSKFNPNKGFPEATMEYTEDGQINGEAFETWMKYCFIPHIEDLKKPVIIFTKDHMSHMTWEIHHLCEEHGIALYSLPFHFRQPIDETFQGAFTDAWNRAASNFPLKTKAGIRKEDFGFVLRDAWEHFKTSESATNGFKAVRFFPWDVAKHGLPKDAEENSEINGLSHTEETSSPSSSSSPPLSSTAAALKVTSVPETEAKKSTVVRIKTGKKVPKKSTDQGKQTLKAKLTLLRRSVKSKPVYHDPQKVQLALDAVKSGQFSVRKAAKLYNIPYSTLSDKKTGRRPLKAGPKTKVTAEDEQKIVDALISVAREGTKLTSTVVKSTVEKVLISCSSRPYLVIFKNGVPGSHWFRNFMDRHKHALTRIPRHRKVLTMEDKAREWFENTEKEIKSVDAHVLSDPTRLYTCDQLMFPVDPGTGHVKAPTEENHPWKKEDCYTPQQVTVLVCGSGDGSVMNPHIVFPGNCFTRDPSIGFPDASFDHSENGCIEKDIFITWLEKHFFPQVNTVQKPVFLFTDSNEITMSLEIHELCEAQNIILVPLPVEGSGILQPLGASIFPSLKTSWKVASYDFHEMTSKDATKEDFAFVLRSAWLKGVSDEALRNGFKVKGIFPWKPDAVWGTTQATDDSEGLEDGELNLTHASSTSTLPVTGLKASTASTSSQKPFIEHFPSQVPYMSVAPTHNSAINCTNNSALINSSTDHVEHLPSASCPSFAHSQPAESLTTAASGSSNAGAINLLPTRIMEGSLEQLLEVVASIGPAGLMKFKTCIELNCELNDPKFHLFRHLYLTQKQIIQTLNPHWGPGYRNQS